MSRKSRRLFAELDEEGNIIVSEWVRYDGELYVCNICGSTMLQTTVEKAEYDRNVEVFVTLHEHRK